MENISGRYINIVEEGLSEELFKTVFFSPLSYKLLIKVVNGTEFHYFEVNDIYIKNSGVLKEDLIGKRPYEVFTRDTADAIYKHAGMRQKKASCVIP